MTTSSTNGDQILNLLGGAKVCQLNAASIVHQNVGPLDVPVHDVVLMQVLQTQQDLAAVNLHYCLLKCACIAAHIVSAVQSNPYLHVASLSAE